MSLYELLGRLHVAGISLSARGEKLGYQCPYGALTADIREAIAAFKPAILAILNAEMPACCGTESERLGAFVVNDGRGRWTCQRCHRIFWAVAPMPTFPPAGQCGASLWDDGLSDAAYLATVAGDIAEFGYYSPGRNYPAAYRQEAG